MVRSEVKKAPTKQKFTSIRLDLWTLLPCAGNTHFSGVFLGYLKKETNKNPGTWWPMFRLDPHLLNGACLFKPTLGKWGKYIECLGMCFLHQLNEFDGFFLLNPIYYILHRFGMIWGFLRRGIFLGSTTGNKNRSKNGKGRSYSPKGWWNGVWWWFTMVQYKNSPQKTNPSNKNRIAWYPRPQWDI